MIPIKNPKYPTTELMYLVSQCSIIPAVLLLLLFLTSVGVPEGGKN